MACLGMMAQQQRQRGAAFRRQLQPPGRGHPNSPDLSDYRAQTTVTQRVLHDRQHFGIVTCFRMDQAVGVQPGLIQSRREQIATAHDPQHCPFAARRNAGQEQDGGGIVSPIRLRGSDLMQGIDPQTSGREMHVQRADPERQRPPSGIASPLDRAQRLTQMSKRSGHRTSTHKSELVFFFRSYTCEVK